MKGTNSEIFSVFELGQKEKQLIISFCLARDQKKKKTHTYNPLKYIYKPGDTIPQVVLLGMPPEPYESCFATGVCYLTSLFRKLANYKLVSIIEPCSWNKCPKSRTAV